MLAFSNYYVFHILTFGSMFCRISLVFKWRWSFMFAVVKSSGTQYIMREGQIISLDRMSDDIGKVVSFSSVVLYNDGNGSSRFNPSDIVVKCEILEHKRDKKIIVFKKKRRKNYRRKSGCRRDLTIVRVKSIVVNSG